MTTDKNREKVLLSALKNVVFDGWTDAVLARACKSAKIDARKTFPDGVASLVFYFSEWADAKTVAALPVKKVSKLRIRDKISLGVKTRLEILTPHKDALRQALSFMAHPSRSLRMTKQVWKTADALWTIAGDTATDYNHYTKRLLLSGVIVSTTLYWLNDDSDDHEKTWNFLDRRIDNVLTVGRLIGKFKKPAA